jgi:hypothetical protein
MSDERVWMTRAEWVRCAMRDAGVSESTARRALKLFTSGPDPLWILEDGRVRPSHDTVLENLEHLARWRGPQ